MQVADPTTDTVRRISQAAEGHGNVLSLFVDLNPERFATPRARQTEITSLLDETRRRVEEVDGDHDARMALRRDVERVAGVLEDPDTKGVHGLAVFSAGGGDLLEVVRLPRPVERRVVIADTAFLEPVAEQATSERLGVLLVSRAQARLLIGPPDHLDEAFGFEDDVHGRVRGEGPAPDEIQRSVEDDVREHFERTALAVFRRWKRDPFDHLVLVCAPPIRRDFERHLHDYLRRRLAGHVEADVEQISVDEVAARIRPLLEERERDHEARALERLRTGWGRGERAAAGIEAVREALAQARVEILLFEPGRPELDDLMEQTLQQGGEVLPVRHHPDLGPHGGVAAVLRF